MKWTKKLPTKSGWYWCIYNNVPQIVEVFSDGFDYDGEPVLIFVVEDSVFEYEVDVNEVLYWSERLEEPKGGYDE